MAISDTIFFLAFVFECGLHIYSYSYYTCCHGNTSDFGVFKFVDVPQPKPIHKFSPIFVYPKYDLELISFFGVSGNNC